MFSKFLMVHEKIQSFTVYMNRLLCSMAREVIDVVKMADCRYRNDILCSAKICRDIVSYFSDPIKIEYSLTSLFMLA